MTGWIHGACECCGPDPEGACCFDLDCAYITRSVCQSSGGVFIGEGIPCDPNPCTKWCCLPDGRCAFLNGRDCIEQGGTPLERCFESECGRCPPLSFFGSDCPRTLLASGSAAVEYRQSVNDPWQDFCSFDFAIPVEFRVDWPFGRIYSTTRAWRLRDDFGCPDPPPGENDPGINVYLSCGVTTGDQYQSVILLANQNNTQSGIYDDGPGYGQSCFVLPFTGPLSINPPRDDHTRFGFGSVTLEIT